MEILVPLTWPLDDENERKSEEEFILEEYKAALSSGTFIKRFSEQLSNAVCILKESADQPDSHSKIEEQEAYHIVDFCLSFLKNILAIPDSDSNVACHGLQEHLISLLYKTSIAFLIHRNY